MGDYERALYSPTTKEITRGSPRPLLTLCYVVLQWAKRAHRGAPPIGIFAS